MFLLSRWLWGRPEPRDGDLHHAHGVTDEDLEVVANSQPPRSRGRLCRRGHRVVGTNAYRRPNGRLECRACRAAASKRYRAKARH
jgi:hypothetical protein